MKIWKSSLSSLEDRKENSICQKGFNIWNPSPGTSTIVYYFSLKPSDIFQHHIGKSLNSWNILPIPLLLCYDVNSWWLDYRISFHGHPRNSIRNTNSSIPLFLVQKSGCHRTLERLRVELLWILQIPVMRLHTIPDQGMRWLKQRTMKAGFIQAWLLTF
jgi:hypothetical protein